MGISAKGMLVKDLNAIKQKAAAQAGKNLPPSNATTPDAIETALITEARGLISESISNHLANLTNVDKQANNFRNEIDSLHSKCQAEIENDELESSFNAILANHRTSLVSSQEEELAARAELEAFKHLHGLQRPAKYPQDSLHHFSLLILFIAIETAVNAFFYEAQSGGLLGGAIIALSVSIVNMGIAVFFGYFFRKSNLNNSSDKAIGYSSLLGFIVLSIVLNLIFSTFRVQFALIPDSSNPLQLKEAFLISVKEAVSVFAFHFPSVDFMSFILFFIGLGCCIIGFYKGYSVDDPCPGYGDLERRYKEAKNDFEKKRDEVIGEVARSIGHKVACIEKLINSVSDLQRRVTALKSEALNSQSDYKANVETIQNELDLVIKAYRDTNSAVRATAQPSYFKEKVEAVSVNDFSEKMNLLMENLDEVTSQAKQMQTTNGKLLNDIKNDRQKAMSKLQADGITTYFEEILAAAEASISKKSLNQRHYT